MSAVIAKSRILPTWLAAVQHLEARRRRDQNVLLEIADPTALTAGDRAAIAVVDEMLRRHCDLSVQTVAGTIFPYRLYLKVGAEELPSRFLAIMARAQESGTWGTYAMRLMQRPGKKSGTFINPLQLVIAKLRIAAGTGTGYQSNYELGVHAPSDLVDDSAFGEVPLYCPTRDGRMVSNYPCLSHLTFKLVGKRTLNLTAIYRSHYYLQRALGNLIGLSHLMQFVAKEAGLQAGQLTCISTDAHLDYSESWGGVTSGRAALARVIEAINLDTSAALGQRPAQSNEACIAV